MWISRLRVYTAGKLIKMWKVNLLLLSGSTEANVLAVRWRLWADLQTAGRMSLQCTYSNRLRRSDRRNAHSAYKCHQKLLLQPEFSTTIEVWVQNSQRGAQDWPDRSGLNLNSSESVDARSLHWGPASYFYIKNCFFGSSTPRFLPVFLLPAPANQLPSIPLGERWLLVALWVI